MMDKNIVGTVFQKNELSSDSVVKEYLTVAADGKYMQKTHKLRQAHFKGWLKVQYIPFWNTCP